uniref:Uncharacterized protein n=1 Tax=Anopheles atroparvus TaxID=41427 RepID=A0AAG5D8J1_ANOAO
MESLGKSFAKGLLSQYLAANRDFEPFADREQKAKLRKEIEQKRAQRDALQRMVLSLTTLNSGIQCCATDASSQNDIMRETNGIVRSIMRKQVKPDENQKETDAPTDDLQVQGKMIEERFQDTVRYQEQILATIHRSRRFVMLMQAKEEVRKAQVALDTIQNEIQQTVETVQREEQKLFDTFLEQAIQIGDEQERLEQKQAQVDGSMRRRETLLQGTLNYDSVAPVAQLAAIIDDQAATVPCANDEQEKEEDDTCEGQMGLNFSSIIEEFPIGSLFKNPNDFPETLDRSTSQKPHETKGRDIVNSSHYNDRNAAAEEKENNRTLRSKIQRRGSVVVTREEVAESPRKRKKKTSEKVESQSKPLGKRARSKSPRCIEACESFADMRAVEPKGKATAATDTLALKRAPPGTPGQSSDNPSDIFKLPQSNVASVKSNTRQQPKDARGMQPAARKQQTLQPPPPTAGEGSKLQASKSVRDPPAKRQTSENNVPEKRKLPLKTRTPNSHAPIVQAPTADGSTDEAIDAPMSPVQTSSSHGSLDFGHQGSSSELDMNVLADFQEGSVDMDDLDFLMNDPPVVTPSKAKKAKKGKKRDETDSFSFDFDAQDSNDSIDQAGNDLF